ncbi:MAG TPA: hypothetical protein VIS03_15605 [Kiloniellaceae bacterium]
MKMTRNRMLDNFNALLGLVLLGLFAGLTAGPALAQAAGGETVSIELNKLEPQESACRAYLVVKNTGEQAFDSLKLDLVMFDRGGVVAKRLAVQAGPLPVGKTSLKVFDVEGNACPDIGSILLNDVLECTPAPEAPGGCLARIAVSARGELSFLK